MDRISASVVYGVLGASSLFMYPAGVYADTTGTTGSASPTPIDNRQPSLAMTQLICAAGPSQDLGTVEAFGGNFAPTGFVLANGQLLNISDYGDLYAVLGTTYGGDGVTTFAVPNLNGRTVVGAGGSLGALGATSGASSIVLSDDTIPSHTHTLPGGGTTAPEGGGQSYTNVQASLALNFQLATSGVYPPRSSLPAPVAFTGTISPAGDGGFPYVGEVRITAGNAVPTGYVSATGGTLSISDNTAVFSLVGTYYGGNGTSNFGVPNVSGNSVLGFEGGSGDGVNVFGLGDMEGNQSTTLTVNQLPAHSHTLPGGGTTGVTGEGQPVNNVQPYLALNYIIALQGVYPTTDVANSVYPDERFLGEVELFAGNFAPEGFAFCNGATLSIEQNVALFALLGTTYGGNGVTTFALPDLRGRDIVGSGTGDDGIAYTAGEVVGDVNYSLSIDQLPAHDHDIPAVPEPTGMALLLSALGLAVRGKR